MRAGRGRFGRLFRDGFRCCPDSDVYPLNLMLFAGCTAEGWRRFWYANLDDLADPAKHLVRWIAGEELERASRPGTESRHG